MIIKKLLLLRSIPFDLTLLGITWIKLSYLPSINFLVILVCAMGLDLITGLIKAWSKGQHTSSQGLRQTIKKGTQYFGFIVLGTLLMNMVINHEPLSQYGFIVNIFFSFIIMIEFVSICENLIEINPHSRIVSTVIRPFMRLIKGKLK